MSSTETSPCSALIVVCPEAERAVGRHRARFDAAAQVGVPAHVTVLYPFLAPEEIDLAVLGRVADVAAANAPFDLVLAGTAWFDEAVLYLEPQDPVPLVALSTAAHTTFPEHPPYGGRFAEVTPHLTVAHDQPFEVLGEVEESVRADLPVRQPVTALELWTGPRPTPDATHRWHRLASFPLGRARAAVEASTATGREATPSATGWCTTRRSRIHQWR